MNANIDETSQLDHKFMKKAIEKDKSDREKEQENKKEVDEREEGQLPVEEEEEGPGW